MTTKNEKRFAVRSKATGGYFLYPREGLKLTDGINTIEMGLFSKEEAEMHCTMLGFGSSHEVVEVDITRVDNNYYKTP